MEEFDVLVKNGILVDGRGVPSYRGSVAIKGERIVAVGEVKGDSKTVIDASSLIISPGFIDAHSHADKTLPLFPTADSYVMQGVTTTVGGNCGSTIAPILEWWPPNMVWDSDIIFELRPFKYYSRKFLPAEEVKAKVKELYGVEIGWGSFKDFIEWVEKTGISVNHVPLAGHNTIRAQVMGLDHKRRPTDKELTEMKAHVQEAMEAGAFGISTGLDYIPGVHADIKEVIELVKVVRGFNGIYATHWRRTGLRREKKIPLTEKIKGIAEALEVGREAGIPVQVSHVTSGYTILPSPPQQLVEAAVKATLKVINDAIAEGLNVAFDIIPNVTGGTMTTLYLASRLTPWVRTTGSRNGLAEALKMTDFKGEIRSAIMEGKWWGLNPIVNPYWSEKIEIVKCKIGDYVGKTVKEIARKKGTDDLETLFSIIIEDCDTRILSRGNRTDDEKAVFLKHLHCMIGLDTYTFDEKWQMKHPPYCLPHPNTFGGMPRYIRRYVREMKVLTLEEAIRRITSLPAKTFKLRDRGMLKPGAYADIVIFDFNEISNVEDPLEPRRYPKGIHHVIINGKMVATNGKHTGVTSGKVLTLR